VSPYTADRELARDIHFERGLPFIEVYVDTPLAECERRDDKGLYAKARRGEITGMTGLDGPYEQPIVPELRVSGYPDANALLDVLLQPVLSHQI
jgi:bifunctional enzyme CysN/CysC